MIHYRNIMTAWNLRLCEIGLRSSGINRVSYKLCYFCVKYLKIRFHKKLSYSEKHVGYAFCCRPNLGLHVVFLEDRITKSVPVVGWIWLDSPLEWMGVRHHEAWFFIPQSFNKRFPYNDMFYGRSAIDKLNTIFTRKSELQHQKTSSKNGATTRLDRPVTAVYDPHPNWRSWIQILNRIATKIWLIGFLCKPKYKNLICTWCFYLFFEPSCFSDKIIQYNFAFGVSSWFGINILHTWLNNGTVL